MDFFQHISLFCMRNFHNQLHRLFFSASQFNSIKQCFKFRLFSHHHQLCTALDIYINRRAKNHQSTNLTDWLILIILIRNACDCMWFCMHALVDTEWENIAVIIISSNRKLSYRLCHFRSCSLTITLSFTQLFIGCCWYEFLHQLHLICSFVSVVIITTIISSIVVCMWFVSQSNDIYCC